MVGATTNHHLNPTTTTTTTTTIKFLCSYGGKIHPRYPDGKLRYQGGQTRVLAVHRSISFSDLSEKLTELCGNPVTLRCQLPTEDLDALISVTCNDDLINLIEEYDRVAPPSPSPPPSPSSSLKIRAFLSLPKKAPQTLSSSSASSSSSTVTFESASPKSPQSSNYSVAVSGASASYYTSRFPVAYPMSKPVKFPLCYQKSAGKLPYYAQGNSSRTHLIHNGNHWQ